MPDSAPARAPRGLHAIALIECGKGALALLAAAAVASLGAARIDDAIAQLAAWAHVDALHRALGAIAARIDPASVQWVAIGLVAYGALRAVEGWGLWRGRAWACWLGAVSVALYLPFDLYALVRHPGWVAFLVLAVNLAVLWILARALRAGRHAPAGPGRTSER